MKYLLNLSTRTIHDANSKDGRCKLKLIGEDNKKVFADYNSAAAFLPSHKKTAKPCPFCLGADYKK